MIGPEIPAEFLSNRSATPNDAEEDGSNEAGPSTSIGPQIPPEVLERAREAPTTDRPPEEEEDEDEDEDDYDDEDDWDDEERAWPERAFHSETYFGHIFDAGDHRICE